jgi:hypothetical protein
MSNNDTVTRAFTFPISTLVRDAKRLHGALLDATVGPEVVTRLTTQQTAQPAADFATRIKTVEQGGLDQSAASGTLGALTQEQAVALTELERLTAGARRSGALAYPPGDQRLRSEFQVGVHDPHDLASELDRAQKILAAVKKYAVPVAQHGWTAGDSAALEDAIATLASTDDDQENAKDRRQGVTATRNAAANVLYKRCLSIQNAARLAYPNTQTDDPAVVEARARYLLDEFPPASGASAGDNPDPHGPPPA